MEHNEAIQFIKLYELEEEVQGLLKRRSLQRLSSLVV